jgi:hypothetical protein
LAIEWIASFDAGDLMVQNTAKITGRTSEIVLKSG